MLTLVALLALSGAQAAPVQLAHSGRLVDATGEPLSGAHTVQVALYDAATDGNLVWQRSYDVELASGYYSLLLSEGTPSLDSDLFDGSGLWLQLAADSAPLGARQPLGAVPRSVHATTVSGGEVVLPASPSGSCTEGALSRDATTGVLRLCHGATLVDVASREQVQALIDEAIGVQSAPLGERVYTDTTRARSYAQGSNYNWQHVSDLIIPFTSRGGPIQISQSLAMNGGGNSACRPMIDGLPASLYTGLDTSYTWTDGLENSNDGWAMWNPVRIYEGIARGQHVLSLECHGDSGSSVEVGNGRMTHALGLIAYDPVESAAIVAASHEVRDGYSVGTGWTTIPGLEVPITAQGGVVRVSWAVPMNGGSHSACRPLLDGSPLGGVDGDTTAYRWSEGLTKTNDGWAMHNRTRLYSGVTAGAHTIGLQCSTDSSSVSLGNSQMGLTLAAVTYPSSGGGVSIAYANKIGEQSGNMSSWTNISGLSTSFTATGGPVEIGVSIPFTNGSHAACRPTLDGAAIPHPTDDFAYIWHEGLARSNDGWGMWDRVRVYDNIAAGEYTLGVQCLADTTSSLTIGIGNPSSGGTGQVWGIAYTP